MFRRFFDEGLAQSSYLLACDRTGQAVIIDPRRDVDEYVAEAAARGLTITHAIETHTHADFVSGARELAALGAIVVSGPSAGLGYTTDRDVTALHDRRISVGDLELSFLHTPGHTPEHISVLARQPGDPDRLFTGDTLFVGGVGRPDLLGESVMRGLARQLYDSLHHTILPLPDDVEVHPGHGAGSLCGAGIGAEPHSTIGRERRSNPLLQHRSPETFVRAVLDDLPETPSYFARMKIINREGPPLLDLSRMVPPPPAVQPRAVVDALASGSWLLDLRPASAFGAGHADGALSMSFGPKIGYWAAWILPAGARIYLLVDEEHQTEEAKRQLLRVGWDAVEGYVAGGFEAWRAAGLPVRTLAQIPTAALHEPGASLVVVDVRSRGEWESGHVPGAVHIPLPELAVRASKLPRDRTVVTICEGGFRSSLAASLLARQGVTDLANVPGGMSGWRTLERTTT